MTACTATYRPSGIPPLITLQCIRTDVDETGRHKGQHNAWEEMPAGVRTVSVPDPDRPGWSMWADEPFSSWRRLWTWDEGGSMGSSNRAGEELTACRECGTLTYAEHRVPTEAIVYTGAPDAYAVAGTPPDGRCYHCRLWGERIIDYPQGWITTGRGASRQQSRLIRLRRADGTPDTHLNSWADGVTGAFGNRKYGVLWDDGDTRGPESSMWSAGRIPWWLDEWFPPNAVLTFPVPGSSGPFGDL